MGREGRARVSTDFTIARMVAQTTALYTHVGSRVPLSMKRAFRHPYGRSRPRGLGAAVGGDCGRYQSRGSAARSFSRRIASVWAGVDSAR